MGTFQQSVGDRGCWAFLWMYYENHIIGLHLPISMHTIDFSQAGLLCGSINISLEVFWMNLEYCLNHCIASNPWFLFRERCLGHWTSQEKLFFEIQRQRFPQNRKDLFPVYISAALLSFRPTNPGFALCGLHYITLATLLQSVGSHKDEDKGKIRKKGLTNVSFAHTCVYVQ